MKTTEIYSELLYLDILNENLVNVMQYYILKLMVNFETSIKLI
jgi:hypothetical protein